MTTQFKPVIYRCSHCLSTFYSAYPGEFVSCQCGKCAVDQTLWYTRHIGGEREEVTEKENNE